jgi:hypothetical protein
LVRNVPPGFGFGLGWGCVRWAGVSGTVGDGRRSTHTYTYAHFVTHRQAVPLSLPHHPIHPKRTRSEVLRRAAERGQRDLVLHEGVLVVGRPDVGRAVAEHHVRVRVGAHLPLDGRAALGGGDVVHQGLDVRDGADGEEVHPEDDAVGRHVLGSHLAPPPGGRAQVDADARAGEEVVLAVDLDELEGGARAVALLLGQVVVLVAVVPLLALQVLLHHG